MSEQNFESKQPERVESTEDNRLIEESAAERTAPNKSRRRLLIGISILAVVLTAAGAAWWLISRSNSQAGKPVPAPRTVTIDQSIDSAANGSAQTLTIPPDQLEKAGIKIETAGEQMASEIGGELAAGVVQANAYRETPVISLTGGIVRRVIPGLGENVHSGQPVAVIFSDDLAAAQARYIALLTETENARRNYERTQKLVGINQPGRMEFDQATAQLKTAEAMLEEHHKHHARTIKLVQIGAASREELEQAATKLATAEAEAVAARQRLTRAKELLDINPATRSESEDAAGKLRAVESEIATVRQKLLLYGMPPPSINALRAESQITSELLVPAPVSGTITSRTVNQGEVVEANKELLRVTDLASVWVIAQVYEKDLRRLREGSGASVTTDAYPDKVFRGQITYIDSRLDENTRTAQVRVELENPNRALRIGTYVRVAFGASGQAERTAPVIPASAVQNLGGGQVVFAATDQPNIFEMRQVRLGPENNEK